eukprot:TRINITY_DN108_c0_g2_i3.p4 TRINITY_DN108_c0_g2~~TRINITY_DN108_c0_g2_i3.p4  ORF type:complete len:276 (-),score=32.69 TRINITY_DN108_c0_g2_i3:3481-4308(-)
MLKAETLSTVNKPMTLAEMENLSKVDTRIKPMLREMFRFPEGKHGIERSTLKSEGIQRINDIVMFHKFAMYIHEANREVIDPIFEQFNAHYGNMFDGAQEDQEDQEKVTQYRMTFRNFDEKEQLRRVGLLADESLVINLWATIEQFANRSIDLFQPNKKKSYKWLEIEDKFLNLGLNLQNAMSYKIVNELRVLNNHIKHTYMVADSLVKFDNFVDYKGKTIDQVPLKTFDYTLAAYNFVCLVINRIGESIYYPFDESDDLEEEEYSELLKTHKEN